MKQIVIKFIEQKDQRIGESADWWFDGEGNLQVRVTDMGDWRYNFLVGRHEMDEAALCKHDGISTEQVDAYCKTKFRVDPDSFSGYPNSPHQEQHNDALAAEWQMARALWVNWKLYGEAFDR